MGKDERLGLLLVATGAVGFSSAILFNRAIIGLNGAQISCFRAIAAFLFFSLLRWRNRSPCQLRRRPTLWPLLTGLALTVGATGALYMAALRETTAATAVLLNNTSALYVALLAPPLLKEPLHPATRVSLPLTLTGMWLVTTGGHTAPLGSWRGVAAGALSGLSYGLTMLISRRLRGEVEGVVQVWWGMAGAILVAAPFAVGTPLPLLRANAPLLAAMGVVSVGLPYALYFRGLERAPAQAVSLVAMLEPVCGVLIGAVLLHEPMTPAIGLGVLLVLTGIALISR